MSLARALRGVKAYYGAKLRAHGPVAAGADWKSRASQETRFAELLRIAEGQKSFSLSEFGCGYGPLYGYLAKKKARFVYSGTDFSPEMIAAARRLWKGRRNARFALGSAEALAPADYVVSSGVFNVKLGASRAAWEAHVWRALRAFDRRAKKGFAFNLLTTYADRDKRRADLYYADPCRYFDGCKRLFSKDVALLHDYGLYEFTILVRKR